MDMSQYRDLFISEAREYLKAIGQLIVDLEKDAGDREKIDALFRAAHSIKGMAASMDYRNISELAHKLEDLMSRVRKETLAFDSGIADLLLEGADLIDLMITDVEADLTTPRDAEELMARVACYGSAEETAPSPPSGKVEPPTVTELPAGMIAADQEPKLRRKNDLGGPEPRQTVRVKTAVLDHLINITGELITNKHRLVNVTEKMGSLRLTDAVAELTRLLRVLHNEVMQVRLMPLAAITDRFPRLVRDLARKNGKDAEFVMEGKEIELDRGILEELSDPLIHILRNAIDHGLEQSGDRIAAGKPPQGTIVLRARRERDQVIITVEDDGRGIDPERLVALAIERGYITRETGSQLSSQEAYLLTCLPGFSTATEVTDVSGRGVGMDAVRATIHSLCGTLTIESELGTGTRIILKLPLTAAIINVLLITSGQLTVAVPVMNIIRTIELRRDLITGDGKQESFNLDGEEIHFHRLNRIFANPHLSPEGSSLPVFVCEVKGRKVGLAVDGFLGHQEVFVKPLGRPLDRLKGVSGGAILGDGKVVFVLDVANLF